jgi:signal transduction histidine kinase
MPLDYRRFVDALGVVSNHIHSGAAGLPAIEDLIGALRVATGAAGATFTEYGNDGGRVIVASGEMAWALGQPIAAEFVDADQPAKPWWSRVDGMPIQVAEPLLARGVLALAGHPVRNGERLIGAVHLYFGDLSEELTAQSQSILGIGAALAGCLYDDRAESPATREPEGDDRMLFLAVAGHELRTPVTVVKGYAGMLSDRWEVLDEPSRKEAARVLNQRADELARLVDRMLGASVGADSGWLVRTVPFDLVQALVHAVEELPAEVRSIVRLDLPNGLPPAYGDPAIIASVLGELVKNAIRATPAAASPYAGGRHAYGQTPPAPATAPTPGQPPEHPPPIIEVQAGADAHTVYFRVLDRGVGISPTHVERAFDRFWRGGQGGDSRSGVGLGLYLVRRLVERQNGWVSLRARDGGGAVAEVRLSRADGPLRRPGEA